MRKTTAPTILSIIICFIVLASPPGRAETDNAATPALEPCGAFLGFAMLNSQTAIGLAVDGLRKNIFTEEETDAIINEQFDNLNTMLEYIFKLTEATADPVESEKLYDMTDCVDALQATIIELQKYLWGTTAEGPGSEASAASYEEARKKSDAAIAKLIAPANKK